MPTTVCPVILCGGSGTRLWPLSTPDQPKQFLPLTSERSMIAETAQRFSQTSAAELAFAPITVVGSARHRSLLEKALPDARLILEPFGRNSAPAIAAVSLVAKPDDLLLILPADHNIQDVEAFHIAINRAVEAAQNGAIVTFGIRPSYPATGYGYIKAETGQSGEVLAVESFVEKPILELAEQYIAEGHYYWNAGIFLFKAQTIHDALMRHAPDIVPAVTAALGASPGETCLLDPIEFGKASNISIDFAVMEHAQNVQVVPVEMGWSDVGDYQALWDLFADHGEANVQSGPVTVENSTALYVNSTGPAIAVSGLHNMVIVATDDTVLVMPKGDADAVKRLGGKVQSRRHSLSLPQAMIDEARDWLWTSFDVWASRAWDESHGGFVEQLTLDGIADTKANRRVRVQARQVYSFAAALGLGWPETSRALDLVKRGLDYIDQYLRHPDGGWLHIVDAAGQAVDDRRDLYDHAFLILAGSAAYKAAGLEQGLALANEAFAFINTRLKDDQHGGWFESIPDSSPRRANPHMHILEAMLALYDATGDQAALDTAREVVTLFETRFFDPATDVMTEQFHPDWRPISSVQDRIFEPGHHYEWATLLSMYEQLTGHDTLSWRRRLIRRADQSGLDATSGFAINALTMAGDLTNPNRRLWPQLEMFRAHLLHQGLSNISSDQSRFRAIMKTYLNWGPEGCWLDETDAAGQPCAKAIPASILYHMVTAFAPLIE